MKIALVFIVTLVLSSLDKHLRSMDENNKIAVKIDRMDGRNNGN